VGCCGDNNKNVNEFCEFIQHWAERNDDMPVVPCEMGLGSLDAVDGHGGAGATSGQLVSYLACNLGFDRIRRHGSIYVPGSKPIYVKWSSSLEEEEDMMI
jgi:hypothetical protein